MIQANGSLNKGMMTNWRKPCRYIASKHSRSSSLTQHPGNCPLGWFLYEWELRSFQIIIVVYVAAHNLIWYNDGQCQKQTLNPDILIPTSPAYMSMDPYVHGAYIYMYIYNDLHKIPQAFLSDPFRDLLHQRLSSKRWPMPTFGAILTIHPIGAFWDSRKSATFPERLGTGSEGGTFVCVYT